MLVETFSWPWQRNKSLWEKGTGTRARVRELALLPLSFFSLIPPSSFLFTLMAGELWRTQGKEGTSRAGDIVLALTSEKKRKNDREKESPPWLGIVLYKRKRALSGRESK